jgi:hypothetical protein
MRPGYRLKIAFAAVVLGATAAGAQLLPQVPVGPVVEDVGRIGSETLETAEGTVGRVVATADRLAEARLGRLRDLVRRHGDQLEMTDDGPAVRGEIIAIDPAPATIRAADGKGFSAVAEERIDGLDMRTVTLRVPDGMSLERALRRLRRIAPDTQFAINHLHLSSGGASAALTGTALAAGTAGGEPIGIVDGGVAGHPSLGNVEQHGFAIGAPAPSAHGTAVASLIAGRAPLRSAAPGATLLVADVYGRDPKGGNALAIARALGLMAQRNVKVVAMSLVGPSNPLLARAVARCQARGMHIVAPVGNDGPAAPPAFPASYKGVIAVTAVDRRNRPLPEAGRPLHLDFAAPGADINAAAPDGGLGPVRGTSFAVPLVAGRLAGRSLAALQAEARDLGARGYDKSFGYGLVCGECRPAGN